MGLGLTICHMIIQRHAGAIAVKSVAGEGTSFDIYLPVGSKSTGKETSLCCGTIRAAGPCHEDTTEQPRPRGRSAPSGRKPLARTAGGSDRPRAAADTQRLLHELEVHQIELESRTRTPALPVELTRHWKNIPSSTILPRWLFLDRSTRPDPGGELGGAAMLGMARSRIIQRRLRVFATPTSRPVVDAFLESVFARPGRQACEALLLTATGTLFGPICRPRPRRCPRADGNWCRLAFRTSRRSNGGDGPAPRGGAGGGEPGSGSENRPASGGGASPGKASRAIANAAESQRLHAQLRSLTHEISSDPGGGAQENQPPVARRDFANPVGSMSS